MPLSATAERADAGWMASVYEGADVVERLVGGGVERIASEPAEGTAALTTVDKDDEVRFVVNKSTGVAHRVAVGWAPGLAMSGLRAGCGWAFSGANALLLAAVPPRPWCSRPGCFRGAAAPDGSDSSGG